MLGVGFFLHTNIAFLTSHFRRDFLYHSKGIVNLSFNWKSYLPVIIFCNGVLKIVILANWGPLTRDIFRAIKA